MRSIGKQPNATRQQLEQIMIFQSSTEEYRRRSESRKPQLRDLEYKVFSQFGDDGIISYLARFIPANQRTFVEFGVEDYRESNTRLLLQRDNWRGLVLDGSESNIKKIEGEYYFWKHDLTAVHTFITAENISQTLTSAGYCGNLGLLSIDIDGVDYWVLKAITTVQPLVLICEYNSILGSKAAVTVPYDPSFSRLEKHHSGLYAGASLRSFYELALERGLRFIGCNSAGNNAYFVHDSLPIPLESKSVEEGFVASNFREARDPAGNLILKRSRELISEIAEMHLIDLSTGNTVQVKDIN